MSSLNPGAASFNVNSQTLQFQMTVDLTSNDIIAGDVVSLLSNGNVRRADNGTIMPYTFDTIAGSTGNTMSAAQLTSTTFVVAYKGISGFLYAVIGTAAGNVITYGAPVALNAVASTSINVCALSSTSFAVSYTGASTFPNVVVCTISGTVITVGTPQQVVANASGSTGIATLSSTAVVVGYINSSGNAVAVVCSISGTTVTVNTPAALNAVSGCSAISVAAITSTLFVASYSNGSTGYINAAAGSISGTTITPGTPAVISAAVGNISRTAMLDSSDFVTVYTSAGNLETAVVSSISGTTITPGTPATVMTTIPASNNYVGLCVISSTQFLVAARSSVVVNAETVQVVVCSQSGGVITAGTQVTVSQEQGTTGALGVSALFLTSGQAIVTYGAVESRAISVPFSGNIVTYSGVATTNCIGVASSSATPGNNLNVVSIGVTATNIAYTLVIGTQYYWDSTAGRPSSSAYSYSLGIALNTQLLLVARETGNGQYFG